MRNLSKSTWLLIASLVVLSTLGTVLVLTLPEGYTDSFHRFGWFYVEQKNSMESDENGEYYFRNVTPHRPVFVFILIAAGIVLVIAGIRRRRLYYSHHCKRDVSMEILEEQFAEGNISREEFIRKRKTLEE